MGVAVAEPVTPSPTERKWARELDAAGRREKEWRKEAEKVVDLYRGTDAKRNSFNILWANTEVLRPSLYSNPPKPDVRRRFRDVDPVGKAVAEILERGLYVVVDHYCVDTAFKADVLDALIVGRGVSWVRYIPKISRSESAREAKTDDEDSSASVEEYEESLDYEQTWPEHVDWKDYRQGEGDAWEIVPWVGRRHALTKDDATDQFGEDAIAGIEFTAPKDEKGKPLDSDSQVIKVADFWEIWDKGSGKVFFLHETTPRIIYPLATPNGEPPLTFRDFFPCAEPLRIVENIASQLPIPMYRLYEQQARELDRISGRINKLVDAMRLRAVYDSSLSEMNDLVNSGDNDMIPAANAARWRDVGGIEKAISWMPIGPAATVLEQLNKARDACKSAIYEIIGISDIMRGSSLASETATAQNLKQQNGSIRLRRMIAEVQRYVRDTLRLTSEVMATKFEKETLAQMTSLNFPTNADKQQVQARIQQAIMAAQAAHPPVVPTGQAAGVPSPPVPQGAPPASSQNQGAPPQASAPQPTQTPAPSPPPVPPDIQAMLKMPSWEDILAVLRNDPLREYRVDVETDSTIASTLQDDMGALTQMLTGLGQMMQTMAPLVGEGALPMEAAKEIVLAVARRAKLGLAVEDALEKMQQPPPKPPPPDPSLQVAQIKAQADQAIAQMREQGEMQRAQMQHQATLTKASGEAQASQMGSDKEAQHQAALDAMQKQHEQALEAAKLQAENLRKATELETQRQIADANNATQMRIAEMAAESKAALASQQQAHDRQMAALMPEAQTKGGDAKPEGAESEGEPLVADYKSAESDDVVAQAMMPIMHAVAASVARPKKVKRDKAGKVVGLEHDTAGMAPPPQNAKMSDLVPLMTQIAYHISKPKTVMRDESGKITGVE